MDYIRTFLEWGDRQKGWSRSTLAGHKSQLTKLTTWYTGEYGREPDVAHLTADIGGDIPA